MSSIACKPWQVYWRILERPKEKPSLVFGRIRFDKHLFSLSFSFPCIASFSFSSGESDLIALLPSSNTSHSGLRRMSLIQIALRKRASSVPGLILGHGTDMGIVLFF